MAQKFANAARAVLAAGVGAGDTTITIVSGGSLFPVVASPDFARAVLQDATGIEIVLITAHTASADSFTVTRAQEGTTARTFAAGSVFGIRVTAADMDEAVSVTPAGSQTLTNKTFGDNPTFSAGTANAVAFLNGSKVLTTGSALTFNGSNTLTFDGGSASYLIGPTGEMLIGEDGSGLYIGNGAGGLPAIPILFGSSATTFQRWFAGGSEQMRLTSTGLGIGTSSPLARLTVSDSSNPNSGTMTLGNNASFNGTLQYLIGPGELRISQVGSSSLGTTFYTNGAERMRLDSSGNLGLGVTPSAWDTATPALQIKERLSLSGYLGNSYVTHNAYLAPSGWKYQTSNAVSQFRFADGSFIWNTAPSGTAGNAISFTQAMTLDASGNLGVGTTSPTRKLHVSGADTVLRLQSSTTGAYAELTNSGGSAYIGSTNGSNVYFETSGSERARITSGGDLLINTTSVIAGARLSVNGLISDAVGNVRAIPPSGTRTSSYTLVKADVGDYVQVGSGGSITIPDAVFAEGDVVSVFNNTSGTVTITCSITTAYIGGADADKATMTLAARGVATILFISGTICVVNGNVV